MLPLTGGGPTSPPVERAWVLLPPFIPYQKNGWKFKQHRAAQRLAATGLGRRVFTQRPPRGAGGAQSLMRTSVMRNTVRGSPGGTTIGS